jgi:hypothetical protein
VDANRPKGNSGPRTAGRGAFFSVTEKRRILFGKKKKKKNRCSHCT